MATNKTNKKTESQNDGATPSFDWAELVPKFFRVPLAKLKPYVKNARVNTNAIPYVKKSIKKYGMLVPIVVDSEKSLVIAAGHTRLAAMLQLCDEEKRDSKKVQTTCLLAEHLTAEQIRQFRLVDNKTHEFSEWDGDILDEELAELTANDAWDASEFGFADPFGEEPDDLDGEDKAKPMNVKVTFPTENDLNRFVENESVHLEETYGAKVSVSGGGL